MACVSSLRSRLPALFLIIAFITPALHAQENDAKDSSRPVTGTYSLEIGHSRVLATYLSPLNYSGTSLGVSGYWSKALPFNPEKAIMEFKGDASMVSLLNPAHTAKMIGLLGDFSWGMSWRGKVGDNWQFTAGGDVSLYGGAYYLLRNGNNPVQAIVNASIDLVGSASYKFKIKKLPVLISDRVQLPSLGIFFCPDYGETYYEIYLGNHAGLVHAGWWGNNFRIENLLSATLDFGRTAMTIGYKLAVYTQWANNLNTRVITNSFVIGVVPGGIGLKKKQRELPENIIYSIY